MNLEVIFKGNFGVNDLSEGQKEQLLQISNDLKISLSDLIKMIAN